ncbi:MAG: hypothetical protein ACI39E_03005 [Acutalibacteraceae bacterium]
MTCPHCGFEHDFKFCPECGSSSVSSVQEPISQAPHKRNYKNIIIIVLVSIAVLVGILLACYAYSECKENKIKEYQQKISDAVDAEYRLKILKQLDILLEKENRSYDETQELKKLIISELPDAVLGYDDNGNAIMPYDLVRSNLDQQIHRCEIKIEAGEYAKTHLSNLQ